MNTWKRWAAGAALVGHLVASGAAFAQPPASQPSRVRRDARVALGLVESAVGGILAAAGTVVMVPTGFIVIVCGDLANTGILFPLIVPAIAVGLVYDAADYLTAKSLWLWDHGVANVRGIQVDRNHPSTPWEPIDTFDNALNAAGHAIMKQMGSVGEPSGGGQTR